MSRKPQHRSSEKILQERNLKGKVGYDRKCVTPSLNNAPKKGKSKPKAKSIDKTRDINSIKNIKHSEVVVTHVPLSQQAKESPFKHKNRPVSNLAQARHARNIEHQLSNLNESVFNESSLLEDSSKRIRYDSVAGKCFTEGKKHMKNGQFEKGMTLFSEHLAKDGENLEAKYLLGVCAFHLENYQEVINRLQTVVAKDPQYRKNAYLFLAIAYKKVFQLQEALLTLTKALNFYPKYYDALILRAKLLAKLKRYYDSLEDLNKCIKLEPKNVQAFVSKADCLRALSQFKQAIDIYSDILAVSVDSEVLLKRGITYIQNNEINEALSDLNKLIAKNPLNSQAYLFKGTAYTKLRNFNEAILSYEQAMKFNSSKKATTKALYEVAKLKIQMGDFYGASYTLERGTSLEVDLKVIDKLRTFVEGATLIMKKKFRKGAELMTQLVRKDHIHEQIKPLVHSFRSYAHFCLCKFGNALADLNNMTKLGYKLDSSSEYNLQLLQGIIHCQNNNFKDATHSFAQAAALRKDFSDPLVYQCLNKVAEYNRSAKTKNNQLLSQALEYIARALAMQDNYNYHFIVASIQYTLGDLDSAAVSVEEAIQKSENHVIKHFYLRGLIRAMGERYKQAFSDFSSVLTLVKGLKEKLQETVDYDEPPQEKEILETYLNRAKCYLLFGEKKKAFQDLQAYISYKPLDSQVHTVAGKLLFSIGACEDAVKAYNYSPSIDKKKSQLLQRAQCYLLLKELNLCLRDLEKIIDLGDPIAKFDYCCLAALKEASKNTTVSFKEALNKASPAEGFAVLQGHIFDLADLTFYKGVFYYYLGVYKEALQCFQKSRQLKTAENKLEVEEGQDGYDPDTFENRIYCDAEIDYNIALCQLMLDRKDVAFKTLRKYESFELVFGPAQAPCGEEAIDLTPFPINNRLCSIFGETEYSNSIRFKLSFCLPKVSPPQITFEIESKMIEQLSMRSTQPRPDAPWIKRNNFGVIFTDQVVGFDIDLKTEKSLKKFQEGASEKHDSPVRSPGRLKNLFALDEQVEKKLARLMEKKEKQ